MLRRWFGGLVSIVSCVSLAGLVAAPASAAELSWDRLSGATGVETSIAVAKHVYPAGWDTVYVASNRNPVDALPAATIGNGPVVLTDGKTLNLGGVKPGKVVLLGGPGAVPATIEAQAKDLVGEGNVNRLWGADRNQTAAAIARYWTKTNGAPGTVYVTRNAGAGSPDAVAGSVLRDGPIVTFTSDASAVEAAAVVKELQPAKVVALGGTGPVSDANLNTVAGGLPTERLAGANRYETAFVIAQRVKAQNPNATNVYLASGTALKDAMVAGAANDGVILLTPPNAAGVNDKATALGAQQIHVIGGTGVLSENTAKIAAGQKPAIAPDAIKNFDYMNSFVPAGFIVDEPCKHYEGFYKIPDVDDECWYDLNGGRSAEMIEYMTYDRRFGFDRFDPNPRYDDYDGDGYLDLIVKGSGVDFWDEVMYVFDPQDPAHPYVGHVLSAQDIRKLQYRGGSLFEVTYAPDRAYPNGCVLERWNLARVNGVPAQANKQSATAPASCL